MRGLYVNLQSKHNSSNYRNQENHTCNQKKKKIKGIQQVTQKFQCRQVFRKKKPINKQIRIIIRTRIIKRNKKCCCKNIKQFKKKSQTKKKSNRHIFKKRNMIQTFFQIKHYNHKQEKNRNSTYINYNKKKSYEVYFKQKY